ncbi:rRNA methyltransferase [Chloroflexales bacterium ZM16-3]|nr:rRNA methyltransferase [Chloroflexales bacterium ZM16-3]
MLHNIVIVLHRPRDVRNIGAVVRAMKNMGFARLRLVDPAPFDMADIGGIAHRSEDVTTAMEVFPDLASALADMHYVVGTSARPHGGRAPRADVAALAGELLARAASGPVAMLFGPEDNGLDTAALDRCHALLSLPCDPDYPSLNLAQAALLTLYELRQAALGAPPPPQARVAAPAADLDRAMELVGAALRAIGFHKSGDGAATERALRALLMRAAPDARELALVGAIAREIVKLRR